MTAKVLRSTGRTAWHCSLLVALLAGGACSRSDSPPQSPVTGPESNTPTTVKGTEQIAWDQPAYNASKLAHYRFLIYVDGDEAPKVADATCGTTPSTHNSFFPCTAKLPTLSPGAHRLQLAAEETEVCRADAQRGAELTAD